MVKRHINMAIYRTRRTILYKSEIDTTLLPYVKNTDYATSSKGGTIKTGYGFAVDNSGISITQIHTYEQYLNDSDIYFIGKGTLENVISRKRLNNKGLCRWTCRRYRKYIRNIRYRGRCLV